MRSILVGAVEGTGVALNSFARLGSLPVATVTLPRERSGRHSDWFDVRPDASRLGVRVIDAADVNDSAVIAQLKELDVDHIFVLGWSQICRPEFLAVPRAGCIGYHPAPLPENRGRAVIPWTILQRRQDTGGTLFWLDEGMDSGDILVQDRFVLAADETARSLYDKHMRSLERMLSAAITDLEAGRQPRLPQEGTPSWCARRRPSDGLIDWHGPAEGIWTLVRAVGDPYPGAFTLHAGEPLRVWDADLVGPAPYWGLPGQVQAITDGAALVQCGDRGHVLLHTVEKGDAGRRPAAEVLRIHERLGFDAPGLQPTGSGGRA